MFRIYMRALNSEVCAIDMQRYFERKVERVTLYLYYLIYVRPGVKTTTTAKILRE